MSAALIAATVAILLKRKDTKTPAYDQHTEGRIRGFKNLVAAADTLQYMRGMYYLSQVLSGEYVYSDEQRHADAELAVARFNRGCELIDIHVADRESVQPVMRYFYWVLLEEDHPVNRGPGVKEYERLRDLLYEALRLTNSLAKKIQDRHKPTKEVLEAEANSRRIINEGTGQHLYDPELKVEMRALTAEAMEEVMNQAMTALDEYEANVKLTRARMKEWERDGL
ncbi:hypothetical protein [Amycolatopsis sp. NPDC004079]|uniref:hypothetical protein n=1 Tax=Amycolatopsis sp. NPDC004079 TaxID=3154549 RepID=UPI0033AAFA9F